MSTQKCYQLLAGIMVGSLLASGVSAESVQLPDIVVTPTTFVTSKKEVGQTMRVITQAQLRDSGATSLAEALSTIVGVSIATSGGTRSIFVRGLGSNHYRFMVDGMDLVDPISTQGQAYLDAMNLSDVDRIEVMLGSQSVIYGSGAIGGVVNIVTNADRQTTGGQVSVGRGTSDTFHQSAHVKYVDPSAYGTSVYVGLSEQYDEQRSWDADGDELDAEFRSALQFKVAQSFDKAGTASFRMMRSYLRQDTDNFGPADATDRYVKATHNLHRLGYDVALGKQTKLRTFHEWTDLERPQYTSTSKTDYVGRLRTTGIQAISRFSAFELLGGIRQRREAARSGWFTRQTQHMTGYMGQMSWFLPVVSLRYGTRAENYSDSSSDTVFTHQFNAFGEIPGIDLLVNASVHTGYREPTLYELHSSAGNKNLRPEYTLTQSVSFTKPLHHCEFSVEVFRTDIDDEIINDASTSYVYQNQDDNATAQGVEYGVVYRPQSLIDYLKVMYMHQETDVSAGYRRPNNQLTVASAIRLGEYRLGGSVVRVDRRTDSNNVTLDPYVLVNASLQRSFGLSHTAYVQIKNLGDVRYQTVNGFGEPGRVVLVGYDYKF